MRMAGENVISARGVKEMPCGQMLLSKNSKNNKQRTQQYQCLFSASVKLYCQEFQK